MEQIEGIPVQQVSASQVIGSLPRLDESDAPVYHQVRQEQIAAGETTRNIVENPTAQEQVIFQVNPDVRIVERIQEQIVETMKEVPHDRVQQRTVEQIVRVPVPQIQESIVKGVKVITQERFPERIVVQNEDSPVPQAFGSDSHVCRHGELTRAP